MPVSRKNTQTTPKRSRGPILNAISATSTKSSPDLNTKSEGAYQTNFEKLESFESIIQNEINSKKNRDNCDNDTQPISTDANYTTSILISARNSLNELHNNKLNNIATGNQVDVEDDFYVDDDDTKVIIIKSLSK